MSRLEEYRALVVGKRLTNVFFTKQIGPYDFMPGISYAWYFSAILELDNELKYQLCIWSIAAWESEEPLIELTHENWDLPKGLVFKECIINELTADEDDELTIHLENGTTIAYRVPYGNDLAVQHPDFDEEQEYEQPRGTPKKDSPKAAKKWWQKLFGF